MQTLFGHTLITTIPLIQAGDFINKHHRHLPKPIGHKFSLGLWINNELRGVITCGRPISRHLDNKNTIEINRLCVLENTPNGCSQLYAKAIKYALKKGYNTIITYTRQEEPGSSLKAANFKLDKTKTGIDRTKKRWIYQKPT